VRRLRFAFRQIAVARSTKLPEPLAMLLDVEDLPSGWARLDQRRWRTGVADSPWSARAKQLGGVTGWRSFQSAREGQWLWVEAMPLASDADVREALGEVWAGTLKNLRAKVRLISEHEGPTVDGLSPANRTLEQETEGPYGRGLVRLAAWGHRSVLNVLCSSAKGEPWTWADIEMAGTRQNKKIDRIVGAGPNTT
jgi:hypothetical protein